MITRICGLHIRSIQGVEFVSLAHNLPAAGDFYVVQFFLGPAAPDFVVVSRAGVIKFSQNLLRPGAVYKLIAMQISNGVADGLWWVDNYIYNPSQLNIEFTSRGQSSGTGDPKSFTGRTTVNKSPVSRTVIAVGIDGEAPVFLAQAQSNENTGQYTLEWQGYDGQVLITALDNYGMPFNSGDARGVGERVHPAIPNGYVYQVSVAGQLAEEPVWPTTEGALVMSGACQLVAVPFYRPKTVGPIVV